MREIRFRGKRIDNGEWVTGAYIHNSGKPFIISHEVIDWDDEFFAPEFWWRVDPSTVGQYTGLKDKNGKEIYEGDITSTESGTFSNTGKGLVKLYKAMFVSYYGQDLLERDCFDELYKICEEREFIGNIHDNPELLKE